MTATPTLFPATLSALVMLPADLASVWREKAELFRDHAEEPVARAYENCAVQLQDCLRAEGDLALTLAEAAAESGYSPDHLGRLVREGKIPNAGRPGAPRIARRDLPERPRSDIVTLANPEQRRDSTNAQIVQSIIATGV